MYSLTRSRIGPNEARMLIQVRVVVSTTSTADRPSTPTLYWIPKTGIQSTVSTIEKPGRAGSMPTSITSDRPKATSEVPSAAQRMAALVAARDECDEQRPDERREGDRAQDREGRQVHRQRPAMTRYEPAITISPRAMPSA